MRQGFLAIHWLRMLDGAPPLPLCSRLVVALFFAPRGNRNVGTKQDSSESLRTTQGSRLFLGLGVVRAYHCHLQLALQLLPLTLLNCVLEVVQVGEKRFEELQKRKNALSADARASIRTPVLSCTPPSGRRGGCCESRGGAFVGVVSPSRAGVYGCAAHARAR